MRHFCVFILILQTGICKIQRKSFVRQLRLNQGIYTGEVSGGRIPHGSGSIRYRNNDASGRLFYRGQWSHGKLSGHGEMHWRNGARYEGTIRDGVFHGRGDYTWPNGDRYIGNYVFGRRNGVGDMQYVDGDRYRGSWRKGKYHGQGEYRWENGDVYIGDWNTGEAEGIGEFTYGSGTRKGERYEGQFRNGAKEGLGTYFYTDGKSFVGRYRAGLRHGHGTLFLDQSGTEARSGIWVNGVYQGGGQKQNEPSSSADAETFLQLEPQRGEGIKNSLGSQVDNVDPSPGLSLSNFGSSLLGSDLEEESVNNSPSVDFNTPQSSPLLTQLSDFIGVSPDIRVENITTREGSYVGPMQDGLPHGPGGTFVYSDGNSVVANYTGDWRQGRKEGRGIMHWRRGDSYVGEFQNDLPHGNGTYRWASGHIYQGNYARGIPEGQGQFTTAQGDLYIGEFMNGLPNGEGEFTYGPNSDRAREKYEGGFFNGAFNGTGKYFFSNGDRYEGLFLDGERSGLGIMFFTNGGFRIGTWRNDQLLGEVEYHRPDGTVETEVFPNNVEQRNVKAKEYLATLKQLEDLATLALQEIHGETDKTS